ncbi:Gfo/Idh/MocA family oxidoreductase [Rhodothermus sp. AH-315-K08]|nr:Gfo/Idh/MocA family oxidoreductase [Rhodothermus sp. AH-315-K08]
MRILLVGFGAIGRRHAEILLSRPGFEIAALRSGLGNSELNPRIRRLVGWSEVTSFSPEAVFICNPTDQHVGTAARFIDADCAIFIEKPIGAGLAGLDSLLTRVGETGTVTYVAYNLRFHPVVEYLKEAARDLGLCHYRSECTSYLPSWRPGVNHLEHYSAISARGGGVILELSHEVDLADHLMDGLTTLRGRSSRLAGVTHDAEDYSDMEFEAGKGPGSIHINFFSHAPRRRIVMDFTNVTFSGDLLSGRVSRFAKGKSLDVISFDVARNTTYERQLDYFLANLKNPQMQNNLVEAAHLFRKIMAVRESGTGESRNQQY